MADIPQMSVHCAEIIQQVIAVPASPGNAHLYDPWEDIPRGRIDGHRAGGIKSWRRNNVVTGHGPGNFFVGCPPPKLPSSQPAKVNNEENGNQQYKK
jgi:hypothetical protein